jgi:flagellar assembly protein FliH
VSSKVVRSELILPARVRTAQNPELPDLASAVAAAEQRGFSLGQAEGRRAAEQILATARERYDRSVADMAAAYSRLVASVEQSAVDLAIRLAEKIVARELESRPQITETLVREALEGVRLQPDITLRVSAGDVARLSDIVSAAGVRIEADPALEPGDYVIDTAHTHLDGRIASQLATLGRAMLDG